MADDQYTRIAQKFQAETTTCAICDECAAYLASLLSSEFVPHTEHERYKNALDSHLCIYDRTDWLACTPGAHGDPSQYCECCEHDKPHNHQAWSLLEQEREKVRRLLEYAIEHKTSCCTYVDSRLPCSCGLAELMGDAIYE